MNAIGMTVLSVIIFIGFSGTACAVSNAKPKKEIKI